MNRRGFLGLLLAAPLAAPAIAKAAVAEARTGFARGGYVRGIAGCSSVGPLKIDVDTSALDAAIGELKMTGMNYPLPRMQEQPTRYGQTELVPDANSASGFSLRASRIESPPLAPARTGDWMQTATGKAFWPLDPRPEEIHIEDIAAALSKLCRYGGHTKQFYSVAEHCVLMAHAAPDGFRLSALLHDASEAYLSDVIRPIKKYLENYQAIEAELERAIARRFTLPFPLPATVKALDEAIIADERDQAMLPAPQAWAQWTPVPPLGVTLQFWSPEKAEYEFLAAFRRYGGHWC